MAQAGTVRVVVCVPTIGLTDMTLPAARLDPGPEFISGGERSLYELAVAGVVAGWEVELRGDINRAILETITGAAGVGPALPAAARRPVSREIIVVPEAYDLNRMAAIHLSGATGVVYALAPPGLFGWDFQGGWALPDYGTVPVHEVGRPETFQAMAALGFSVWSNAHGITEAAQRAGIEATWVGTGTPVPFGAPAPSARVFDVAVVGANRWLDWAEQVVAQLPEYSVLRVPPRPSVYSLCDDLATARVLLWPSRVEGMSRISREARAVGTVPVALDTNPFATRADHGDGVVLVPDLASLAGEARRILDDPTAWAELSERAMRGARAQADWDTFVARIDTALSGLSVPADAGARHEFGSRMEAHLGRVEHQWAARLAARDLEVAALQRDSRLGVAALEAARQSEAELEQRVAACRSELQATQAALSGALGEVQAFRSRRVVRLLDRLVALVKR